MEFVVITRLGLGVRNPQFYEEHLRLASLTVAPSLHNQSDQNFTWIVAIDARAPAWVEDRVASIAPRNHETWRIDALQHGLNPSAFIVKWQRRNAIRQYIARIDDDDLLHRDFVRLAREHLGKPTVPAALTFPCGLNLTASSSVSGFYPWIGLGLTTYSPDGAFNSYTVQHNKLKERLPEIEHIEIETDYPMWIRTWRSSSVSSAAHGIRAKGNNLTVDYGDFGLTPESTADLLRVLAQVMPLNSPIVAKKLPTVLAMKREILVQYRDALARRDKVAAELMAQIFYRI